MVILHVKRCDESLFLFESKLSSNVEDVTEGLVEIYNGCLKIRRLCTEIEHLRDYGIWRPVEMHDLLEEQIKELKLTDVYEATCNPNGGYEENKDPTCKRNGRQPKDEMKSVLNKTIAEAQGIISKEQITSKNPLTLQHIQDAVSILKAGIEIAYPMDIPPYDPIRLEFENRENLSGTQDEKKILHPVMTQVWFAGKPLENGNKLSDYFGANEKTKVVVKLQQRGCGPPAREPILNEEEKKAIMMTEFKRREQLRKLEEDEDHSYLDSAWADNLNLKKSFHGVQNITWKPH